MSPTTGEVPAACAVHEMHWHERNDWPELNETAGGRATESSPRTRPKRDAPMPLFEAVRDRAQACCTTHDAFGEAFRKAATQW